MTVNSQTAREIVTSELRRSPLATAFTVIGGLASTLSVILVLSPTAGSLPTSHPILSGSRVNYVIGTLFGLGLSAFWATMSRLVHQLSPITSFFSSILFAAFNILLCTLTLEALDVGFPINRPSADVTASMIYWTTVVVFLALNAERVGMDIGRLGRYKGKPVSNEDAWGTMSVIAIALLVWLGLLSSAHTLIAGAAKSVTG